MSPPMKIFPNPKPPPKQVNSSSRRIVLLNRKTSPDKKPSDISPNNFPPNLSREKAGNALMDAKILEVASAEEQGIDLRPSCLKASVAVKAGCTDISKQEEGVDIQVSKADNGVASEGERVSNSW
eukprot:185014-Amorphochlora_amoeboformis.AAC.1